MTSDETLVSIPKKKCHLSACKYPLHRGFVLSDSLLRLVKESKQLDDLFPLLLKEAEERATDLLLKVLDPLVKAPWFFKQQQLLPDA